MSEQLMPPLHLIREWDREFCNSASLPGEHYRFLCSKAAQWGADQKLEECCEWLHGQNLVFYTDLIPSLRASCRPKPPSLKEQALAALRQVGNCQEIDNVTFETIRRALEALPE
jgi:hypothetical protein